METARGRGKEERGREKEEGEGRERGEGRTERPHKSSQQS